MLRHRDFPRRSETMSYCSGLWGRGLPDRPDRACSWTRRSWDSSGAVESAYKNSGTFFCKKSEHVSEKQCEGHFDSFSLQKGQFNLTPKFAQAAFLCLPAGDRWAHHWSRRDSPPGELSSQGHRHIPQGRASTAAELVFRSRGILNTEEREQQQPQDSQCKQQGRTINMQYSRCSVSKGQLHIIILAGLLLLQLAQPLLERDESIFEGVDLVDLISDYHQSLLSDNI